MKNEKLSTWADISTIAASVVAIIALVFATYQFIDNQKSQREATHMQLKALEYEKNARASNLFIKYNDVMALLAQQQRQDQAEAKNQTDDNDTAYWQESLAITLIDSLVELKRPDWDKTVDWMISNHLTFIQQHPLDCDNYSEAFISKLMSASDNTSVCLETSQQPSSKG